MNNPHFVPSTLHVTANMVNITNDLEAPQTKSIGELLEEKNTEQVQDESSTIQCGREDISEHN